MAHINIYLDDETASLLRKHVKKQKVSMSHYINNLVQKALILGDEPDSISPLLKHPNFVAAFKKLLVFNTENLTLMRHLINNFHDDGSGGTGKNTLKKAKAHAESFVAGLFEE